MRRHYFGYTVVTVPKSAPARPDFAVRDVANFGVAAGGGSLGVGYNRIKDVSLPPDGAIYLEVQTDAQFEEARKLIQAYGGICIIQKNKARADASAKP